MKNLDAQIDELYQRPLAEFTSARTALAKTLTGDAAAQVKRLPKPPLAPWAVNQLYWRNRHTWERLRKAGEALRTAQIAALKGRSTDLAKATASHRQTVADAVRAARSLAEKSGAHPNADEVSAMLEALSLAAEPPEYPGRWTQKVKPAGFEALAGIVPAGQARKVDPAAERRAERAAEAEREKHAADLKAAEAAVARAEAKASAARQAWERAQEDVDVARRALADLRTQD